MDSQPTIKTLDTRFMGESSVIAVYLLESDDGLILVDCGPETVFEGLKTAIAAEGYDWQDVRHVLLTHIHFDHAGAAWKFAQNGAKVYVHPIGLPHMQNPEKLWNSAKRIYQGAMESLWGEMHPIDPELLVVVDEGDRLTLGGVQVDVHYTPGHAVHHNAYQIGDVVFAGDVAGVKIHGGPPVPPCPPPDIDVDAWKRSIQTLRDLNPTHLYLAHFGAVDAPLAHLDALEATLDDWAMWIKPHFDAGAAPAEVTTDFVAYTQEQLRKAGVSEADLTRYEAGNPSFMSVTGLMRYWKLKEAGRL